MELADETMFMVLKETTVTDCFQTCVVLKTYNPHRTLRSCLLEDFSVQVPERVNHKLSDCPKLCLHFQRGQDKISQDRSLNTFFTFVCFCVLLPLEPSAKACPQGPERAS